MMPTTRNEEELKCVFQCTLHIYTKRGVCQFEPLQSIYIILLNINILLVVCGATLTEIRAKSF
jgi:hypothetical protein